ncbi:NAD-dependent epimerase/dehydratase family protein [Aureimonas jatrophae]|uniref:UDP-glucose 4-epimerase n=1 Tax=Aureimonas jatrophae TaxID=1166073 RepID=A0A1H0KKV9_9HYPH|nr:NAD-dependent epimerase/dehydratase family protein [Aureimonas jatrophae]MBB3948749.1 nucleoside-diphosphate-sugar epimerase [Aureimonas jatrophae]SDO56381.1 UDP-glucose 4-epimerase [Aureimonas jatrophae]
MRILLTGSRGFIGRHLLPFLQARGHEVVPLLRGHGAAPDDLRAVRDWTGWPDGIEAVAHLAALNPARGAREALDDAALMAANAQGTRALASRAAGVGARVVVVASTGLVHGLGEAPVTEAERIAPQNLYAASKLAAEAELAQSLEGGSTRGVALRLPPVFGPGGRGAIAQLRRLTRLPVPVPVPDGGRRSVLWLGDALEAFARALEGAPTGGPYLVAADEAPTLRDMAGAMRGGAPLALPSALPRLAARLLGRGETWRRVEGSLVFHDARFRRETNWRPTTSALEALGWEDHRMIRELERIGARP